MYGEMIVLDYWKDGGIRYWIDTNDPLHGYSLWKRGKHGDSTLVRDVPARFGKYFPLQSVVRIVQQKEDK